MKIDLLVFFYCLKLDEKSQELNMIMTLFGEFWYQRLPMGVQVSSDYAQALIKNIFKGLNVDYYIDHMDIWTNGTIDFHFEKVRTVLEGIHDNGLKCNPLKCD